MTSWSDRLSLGRERLERMPAPRRAFTRADARRVPTKFGRFMWFLVSCGSVRGGLARWIASESRRSNICPVIRGLFQVVLCTDWKAAFST